MLHFFETEILRLHVQRPIQPMRRQFTYWCCWWSLDYCVLNDLKRLECNNNNICVWIFAIIACGPNKSGFVAYAAAAGSALNHVSFVSFGLMFWVSDSWATVDAATSLLHFGWRGDVEKKKTIDMDALYGSDLPRISAGVTANRFRYGIDWRPISSDLLWGLGVAIRVTLTTLRIDQ